MSLAIVGIGSSFEGLKTILYSPRCRPDGDVVVDSLQHLNSPCKSEFDIWKFFVGQRCLQRLRNAWIFVELGMGRDICSPLRISSAKIESAAQLSCLSGSVVKGDPAHWLKWQRLRSRIVCSNPWLGHTTFVRRAYRALHISLMPHNFRATTHRHFLK